MRGTVMRALDPDCVKTKLKNLSSARHYDQFRFRFHTTKTLTRHWPDGNVAMQRGHAAMLSFGKADRRGDEPRNYSGLGQGPRPAAG